MTIAAKRVLLQGATGSVGSSVISVLLEQADRFHVVGLSTRSKAVELLRLARQLHPDTVAIESPPADVDWKLEFASTGVDRVFLGEGACTDQARKSRYDLLVNALSGTAGYEPTYEALHRGKSVALANKETLVAAGPVVIEVSKQTGARIIPIDSEHSAIMQCLLGESRQDIRRIWLTSSGGPFWGRSWDSLKDITPAEALAHPTWKMGKKITIDSATLFNKGLEVIEAVRLFDVDPESVCVTVHRQSVIHSMVEFCDGSFKAQLSTPDMRLPILYALGSPDRLRSELVRTDLANNRQLTFEELGPGKFPCLDLAYTALRLGGTAPAALVAADEVAVDAFLRQDIGFTEIPSVIESVIQEWPHERLTELAHVRAANTAARTLADQSVQLLLHEGTVT